MATHAAIPSNAVGLFIRWVVLGAALVAELFGLTLRFESPLASAQDPWWVHLLAFGGLYLAAAASAGCVGFLVNSSRPLHLAVVSRVVAGFWSAARALV